MLTPKQENLALATVRGLPPIEAYRHAYDADNMSDAAASNEAYKLLRHPEITLRIEELRELIALKTLFPLSERLTILKDIATGVIESKPSEKTGAIKVATDIIGDGAATRKIVDMEHRGTIETIAKTPEQMTDDELDRVITRGEV